jgi:hypothetical protein
MRLNAKMLAIALAFAPLTLASPVLADKAPVWTAAMTRSLTLPKAAQCKGLPLSKPCIKALSFALHRPQAAIYSSPIPPAMRLNMVAIVPGQSAKAIQPALIPMRGQLWMASSI